MSTDTPNVADLMQTDTARLLGMIMNLAGEVFVLKAEVAGLRAALLDGGATSDVQLTAAVQDERWKAWLQREGDEFTAAVLKPFLYPDRVPDVTHLMERNR